MRITNSNVIELPRRSSQQAVSHEPEWMDEVDWQEMPVDYNRTIRLLVADDDDVDREKVQRLLSKLPLQFKIVCAASGQDALNLLRQQTYDCVLLDYRLGDMDGIDVMEQLPAQLARNLPVIMVTGFGDEQTAVRALRMGVYDYLPKGSLTPETLGAAIESVMRRVMLQKELAVAQQRLRRQSLFDELTGLPNRYLFFDRLEHEIANAERDGKPFAVLVMDLDLFKQVNDTLGHEAGDTVLSAVGKRFAAMARKSDTIARIGGDEFAAVLHGTDSQDGACQFAHKLVDVISEPIVINDSIIHVGISIGIVLYPHHGTDSRSLYTLADEAMYDAKQNSRHYTVYAPSERGHGENTAITQRLPHAIRDRELLLEYQPKLDLRSGRVTSAEALLRWHSSEMGRIMPDHFIPAAERCGLVKPLTRESIRLAAVQLQRWRQQGIDLPLAVNLSGRMLDDLSLPDFILETLQEHDLQPADLLIEITETSLASSQCRSTEVIAALTDAGLRLSIDDFGSGFTSFRSIRDIHISEIKIDRLFIRELELNAKDESIVRSIALLAQSLGVPVVAEGVEQESMLEQLLALGCTHAQGYCVARPMAEDNFTAWYRQQPAAS